MPITVMISLVVTVALFLISLLFRIAARLNLTLPLLYFLAVSTILNPWAATHEKLAFAILYLLTAFSVLSWIFALRRKWQEHQYYKVAIYTAMARFIFAVIGSFFVDFVVSFFSCFFRISNFIFLIASYIFFLDLLIFLNDFFQIFIG